MNILTVVSIFLSRVSPFSTVDIVQLRRSTCCSQKLIQISCILMSGLLESGGGAPSGHDHPDFVSSVDPISTDWQTMPSTLHFAPSPGFFRPSYGPVFLCVYRRIAYDDTYRYKIQIRNCACHSYVEEAH